MYFCLSSALEETPHTYLIRNLLRTCCPLLRQSPSEETGNHTSSYKSSPFYVSFWEVAESAKRELEEQVEDLSLKPDNPLHAPGFVDYSLMYLLPFFPLWSRYIQSLIFPSKENPLSNSSSENMFRRDKEQTLRNKTYQDQEASQVMSLLVSEDERRLLEVEFDTDFKKYEKKVPVDNAQEQAVKIWKPNKSRRFPGGFFSKPRTTEYAKSLFEKVMRAANRRQEEKRVVPKEKKGKRIPKRGKSAAGQFVCTNLPPVDDISNEGS